jgi:hypothetical protein
VVGALVLAGLGAACQRKPAAIAEADPKSRAVLEVLMGRQPTITWAREARVVTTVKIVDAKIDGVPTEPHDILARQTRLSECFEVEAPATIDVELDVKAEGQVGARRVKLEGPSANPLRGCLTIALRTLEFPPPGKPAPGTLRLAVTQSLFVPPL